MHNGICPVCKNPLTIGVARRVEQLADRTEEEAKTFIQPFAYVLPLPEILAEILGFNEDSLKVKNVYAKAIAQYGNEFAILQQVPIADIEKFDKKLALAITRLRANKTYFKAGYDNVHGRIYFFDNDELKKSKQMQMELF